MTTRSTPLERNYTLSEGGANRSKETRKCRRKTREVERRGKPLQKKPENFRRRRKPLERDSKIPKQTRILDREQTARQELENFRTRSKPIERNKGARVTREIQNKEQTARKRLKNSKTDYRVESKEQTVQKGLGNYSELGANRSKETREFQEENSKVLERDERLLTTNEKFENQEQNA